MADPKLVSGRFMTNGHFFRPNSLSAIISSFGGRKSSDCCEINNEQATLDNTARGYYVHVNYRLKNDIRNKVDILLLILFRSWRQGLCTFSRVFFVFFLAGLVPVFFQGCGQKEDVSQSQTEASVDKYADWTWYSIGRVKIFHPPEHLHLNQFKSYCDNYEASIRQVAKLLAMEPPTDTLIIYYYTGFGQGREFTGREYPFLQDSIIHFWLPSFTGPTLVDWMLPKWVPAPPAYPFLRHGLRALFDFSGQNYHQATYNNLRDRVFVRLRDLPSDPSMDSNTERVQTAEAASFCAFVIAQYGALRLKTIYQYKKPFDEMVPEVFQKPLDSLEQDWLTFVWHNLPDSVRTDQYRQMAQPKNLDSRSVHGMSRNDASEK